MTTDCATGVAGGPAARLTRMPAPWLAVAGLMAIGVLAALLIRGAPAPSMSAGAQAGEGKAAIADAYGKLPLRFEPNRGQSDPQVKFLSRGPGYGLFLTQREAVLSLRKASPSAPGPGARERPGAREGAGTAAVVRMRPLGASPHARLTADERQPGTSNYLSGNDRSRWRTGVPGYGRVTYHGIYPGVDLVYHGRQGKLEYDFVLAPGADPKRIALSLKGARRVSIDRNGDLLLATAAGVLRQQRPVVYQQLGPERRRIPGRYVLEGKDRVGFRVGAYDRSRPLVIDPVVVYSTYLGGSGDDSGYGIAVDSSGSAYVTGSTFSTNFPTKTPLQAATGGGGDVFLTKLDPSGSSLAYSTYLGGSSSDIGYDIAVDSAGSAYLTGATHSPNFPIAAPAGGLPVQPARGGASGADAFFAKVSPSGSLSYSTYLGGTTDDQGFDIAVDSSGSAYVTGFTFSANFPTKGALQGAISGGSDAFVAKLNSSGSPVSDLVYSTYLGGSSTENGNGIAVDSSGSAYVTGWTYSANFPTKSAVQTASGGQEDAFATKLSPGGSSLTYSTYLGGSFTDSGVGIAVDPSGSASLTGHTDSTNFPTQNPLQATSAGSRDAFATKLSPSGSAREYSTYLGGSSSDAGAGIAVDASGSAYLTGNTQSTNFPTTGPVQGASGGGVDAFATKLNPSGSAREYSTYLGGSSSDAGAGIAVDASGSAYLTGNTFSGNFPTASPVQAAKGGSTYDAFVTKLRSAADLSLTMTDAPDPAQVGRPLTYTLSVHNPGPEVAKAVSVRDELPASVDFVSASEGCTEAARVVTCNLSDVAGGALVRRQITVRPSAVNGALPNTATVQSQTFDQGGANNSASATTDVRPAAAGSADLSVSKTASPEPAHTGEELTYTLTAHNAGPDPAEEVALRDQLPSGVTLDRAPDGCTGTEVVTCAVAMLAPGASVERQIVVRPTSPAPMLLSTATVQSAAGDPDSTNNAASATTEVRALADLSITKTDSPDPVDIGQNLTYTLTAQNLGPDAANGVTIVDRLPSGASFRSASAGCTQTAGVVSCNLGTLASGAPAQSREIVVGPTGTEATLSNSATVQSSTDDLRLADNTDTATTEVKGGLPSATSADLSLAQSDSPDPVEPGGLLTYTLTATNAGPTFAEAVIIRDELPAGVDFVSASQGCSYTLGVVTCEVRERPRGSQAVRQIVVRPQAPDRTLLNRASVESPTPDPDGSNNSAVAGTAVRAAQAPARAQAPAPGGGGEGLRKPSAPEPSAPGCLDFSAATREGGRLGPVRLGETRARQRKRLKGARPSGRGGIDRYCMRGGGELRIGYPGARLRRALARSGRRTGRGALLILTSSKRHSVAGIRPGARAGALTRLRGKRSLRVGRSRWLLAAGDESRLCFRIRGGRIIEAGIADKRLTASARDARQLLSAWPP